MIPSQDKDQRDHIAVVIKATFDIQNGAQDLNVSENQEPLAMAPVYWGDPGVSSLKYTSDAYLYKPHTDVVLNGTAYARQGPVEQLDAGFQVGPVKKLVRVIGNRVWYRGMGSWLKSNPVPFEEMALRFENAFGGEDRSHPNPEKHRREEHNPVGKGFASSGRAEHLDGLALPNLENPRTLMGRWSDKPKPAAFGFVDSFWMPRISYAGTYDKQWEKTRCPLLPDDFDSRFFNAAPADQLSQKHLTGGDPIRTLNVTRDKDLAFFLPQKSFEIAVWIKTKRQDHTPVLDTVVIEPDENRLLLTWRASVPCPREFLYIDAIRIKEI